MMSRLSAVLSIVLLLAAIAQPAPAFNPLPENPTSAGEPGYRLNSEGDEWVWVDPNQVEITPPAPPLVVQDEKDALPGAGTDAAANLFSAQAQAEAALGAALDRARESGPQAVLEFAAAQPNPQHPLLQAAVLDAQLELSAPAPSRPAAPSAPRVSRNSGPCTYDTIQAAITAAVNGDTIRVSTGVYTESLDVVAKTITIQGGYDAACTNLTGGLTEVRASVAGSVVDVSSASVLTLRGLGLTKGSSVGAGVDVLGGSRVTLDGTDVHHNNGASGAGIYVGGTSVFTYTNDSDIYSNVSSSSGGGAIVYGKLFGFNTSSDVYSNSAVNGAGFAVYAPGRLVLDNSDVVANIATQLGGGIFVSGAAITLTNSVFVGETAPCCQSAASGGGIYAYNSRVTVLGSATSIINNTATGNGGGIYLTNFSNLDGAGSLGYDSTSGAGNDAVLGAGLYTISSTVSYSGRIINNIASNSGGGIYADRSRLALSNATVGGKSANQHNQIGATGLNGAGLYLINSTHAAIDGSTIVSNTLSNPNTGYGGGLYVRAGSVVTMTNSFIQEHSLPSAFDGRGGAMYLYDATATLSSTQVLSNTTKNLGGGMRLFGASTLNIRDGSVFRNNKALGGVGGAIAATNSPDIKVSDSAFLSNSSSSHGGAFYLDAGRLDFTGAWDLRSNTASGNGGAVALVGTANVSFRSTGGLFPTSLALNHAGGRGGAVYTANNQTVEIHATSGYRINLDTNSAGSHGGALYADAGAHIDVYGDVLATSNSAGGSGGLAYLSGGARIWLDDYFNIPIQVWANTAASGGAIYASDSPRIECDGAIFGISNNGNKALTGSGGALYLSGSTLTADNCTFGSNQAQAGSGGAIAAYTSTVTIDVDYPTPLQAAARDLLPAGPAAPQATACDPRTRQCSSLYANSATADGGAVYANASKLSVNSSTLHRNTAQRGGAIYQDGAGATGVISNTLVYSNTSLTALGAGIRVTGGAMTIRHATLANNVGGAGYSPGAVLSYIFNTIIWGNSSAAFGALTLADCNIDQGGTAGLSLDPLFAAPGGGEDYRLRLASPAVEACSAGLPLDLLNTTRPQEGGFDMGAYELVTRRLYLPMLRK